MVRRPGVSALNRGPDAISRHPEGRDHLILARAQEWNKHRAAIKGIQDDILRGHLDDDEPKAILIEDVSPEKLAPVPYEILEKA